MWKHFVVMGDSVALGVGDEVNGNLCEGWAQLLYKSLAKTLPELNYENLAARGKTSSEIKETQLHHTLSLKPDLVCVMAGGNDVLKDKWDRIRFETEFEQIIETLTINEVTVFTCTVPEFPILKTLSQNKAELFRKQLMELNDSIKQICLKYGVLYIDTWHAHYTLELTNWSRDGIHPNANGYRELALAFIEMLHKSIEEDGRI